MNNMPLPLRKELNALPEYHTCMRNEIMNDHVCIPNPLDGKLIEWEHVIIYGGKQVQEMWCIIPLCWWAHSGPGLIKEINYWIALNRAQESDLERFSKVENYKHKKDYLNKIYGVLCFSNKRRWVRYGVGVQQNKNKKISKEERRSEDQDRTINP